MKAGLIIIAVILFNMLSCNIRSNKFDMIESKGLDADNLRLNAIMFQSKDIGFIAGSSDVVTHNPDFPEKDSNQFAFVKRTALLFKTADGGGTWVKKDFGEGSFQNVLKIGDKIFAVKTSEESFHSFIYSSNDLGSNWIEETSFPNAVTDIFLIDNRLFLIAKNAKGVFQLYVSKDSGKSWSVTESPLPIYDAILNGQQLLYLSSNINNDYRKNLLVKYNTTDGTNKVIELPKEFDCYFLTNYNGEVKLTGLKDGHVAVYSLQKDNQVKYEYSYLKDANFFPQGYYNNKDEEWIIVGKRGDADVSNKILKTNDNGKNWEIINFEKEKYIKPFYFYNDNGRVKTWFYAGSGKFQVLQ